MVYGVTAGGREWDCAKGLRDARGVRGRSGCADDELHHLVGIEVVVLDTDASGSREVPDLKLLPGVLGEVNDNFIPFSAGQVLKKVSPKTLQIVGRCDMALTRSETCTGFVKRPLSEAITWKGNLAFGALELTRYKANARDTAASRRRNRYLRGSTLRNGQG